jgi:hypothetical protein
MGVDAALFQQWLARDLIPFKTVQAGNRTWRRFDVREVPRLVLISELVAQGIPIGDATDGVDTILNWKYKEGAVPGAILWFRQIHLIVFATAEQSVLEVVRKQDCASCVLLSFDQLKHKVENASSSAGKGC